MSRAISYITSLVAIGLLVAIGSGVLVGTASADCTDPTDGCSQTEGITNVLTNIVEIVIVTLRYAGFVTLAAGALLWFTASANSERAQNGVWLITSGALTIVFYIGYEAFIGLLEYVSAG